MTIQFIAGLGTGAFLSTLGITVCMFRAAKGSVNTRAKLEKYYEDSIIELKERNQIDKGIAQSLEFIADYFRNKIP